MSRLQEVIWKQGASRVDAEPVDVRLGASPERVDLTRIPWLQQVLVSRWPQFLARALALAGFVFTISFAFPKLNNVSGVLSDPLGWGWNLLGIANPGGSPDVSRFSSLLQIAILLVGLFWSARLARRLGNSGEKFGNRQLLPILAFCLAFSLAMLWLLIG